MMINCPLIDKEIDSGDCVVLSDIAHGMFKEECMPMEYKEKESWREICINCKYHDY